MLAAVTPIKLFLENPLPESCSLSPLSSSAPTYEVTSHPHCAPEQQRPPVVPKCGLTSTLVITEYPGTWRRGALQSAWEHYIMPGSITACLGAWRRGALQSAQEHGRSTIECPGSLREGALQSAQEHWGEGALHECSGGQVGKALQSTQEQGGGAINNMSWLS